MEKEILKQTAGEKGWYISRYNLYAPIPGSDKIAIVNLMCGSCAAYTPIELYLLKEAETLVEDHPILERFKKRGLIVNYDELAALNAMGRFVNCNTAKLSLVICPTMGCNFDCPYCFEDHRNGIMDKKVRDDVVLLAERIMHMHHIKRVSVTWYGGEPLLGMDVITELSDRLMELAEKEGADYTADIITNGYLLTRENVDTLAEKQIKSMQITLDGIGKTHDKTRHLKDGGPSFDRIVENLRTLKIPFDVVIRQNTYKDNINETEKLRDLVDRLAAESGNKYLFLPARVDSCSLSIAQAVRKFRVPVTRFCSAPDLFFLVIDETGRLSKCLENAGREEHSFGRVSDWDPLRPLETAEKPDLLSGFLNAALPLNDEKCRECVWLPLCAGGCPGRRVVYRKPACVDFRDDPEGFVLALYQKVNTSKDHFGE